MAQDAKSRRRAKRSSEKLPPERLQQLDRRLLTYALAAAGAIALSSPAHAEIVFTQTNSTLTDGVLHIDLNHDGVNDFTIRNYLSGSSSLYVRKLTVVGTDSGAAVIGRHPYPMASAWDTPPNWPVGADSPKVFVGVQGKPAEMAQSFCSFGCFPRGPWRNKTNRFLGFHFLINGEVHYGWARLSVDTSNFQITASLTGYAYETTPNKTILAGDKGPAAEVTGTSVEAAPLQPSLFLLSQGWRGMNTWRPAM